MQDLAVPNKKISLTGEEHNPPSPYFKNPPKNTQKKICKEKNNSNSLKLKDYLRLKSLSQRSNSNQSKRQESVKHKNDKQKRHFSNSTQILKQQIISDMKVCNKKITDLQDSSKKIDISAKNPEQQYQELIFLCEIQHLIKQKLMPTLEQINQQIRDHTLTKMAKYSGKTNLLNDNKLEIRERVSPLRKKIDYLRATEALPPGFTERKIFGSIV